MPRKKPFSSKQKRLQLQQKRHKKREREQGPSGRAPTPPPNPGEGEPSASGSESEPGEELPQIDKLNEQPKASGSTKYDPNRYRLHFERESQEEIEQRKMKAKKLPLTPVSEVAMEVCVEDIYHPGSVLDIPKRPPWGYHMTKEEVEGQEEAMFEQYLATILSHHRVEELSHFEHNLETWRQLWRVLEVSDVVLLITDVRHPALHFSPALYKHVVEDLKKTFVLVLNKVDLVPPQVAVAWRHYFLSNYPELSVISFTCHPNPEASLQPSEKVSLKFRRRRRGRLPSAVGPRELFKVIEAMYRNTVDLAGWQQKLDEDSDIQGTAVDSTDDSSESEDSEEEGTGPVAMETIAMTSSPLVRDDVSENVLTIGMVGHPNVGKSSLLNGLMGKKVVSTSRTPGHTKHFQTIFLTRSIRLCDCPGLVFPSLVDRQLQILSGIYPVAQVREPYTAVGYLAERVPLMQLLRLEHPNSLDALVSRNVARSRTKQLPPCKEASCVGREELRGTARSNDTPLKRDPDEMWTPLPSVQQVGESEEVWTAWDICDAWAAKKGYFTSRAARYDTYRAANSILRLAVDGRIVMYFRPPGFSREKANWECHPEVADMIQLQRIGLRGPQREIHTEEQREEESTPTTGERHGHQENKFALLMQMEDADT